MAGQRPSTRDREAEFHTAGLDAATLLQRLAEAEACAREVLADLSLADLASGARRLQRDTGLNLLPTLSRLARTQFGNGDRFQL